MGSDKGVKLSQEYTIQTHQNIMTPYSQHYRQSKYILYKDAYKDLQ